MELQLAPKPLWVLVLDSNYVIEIKKEDRIFFLNKETGKINLSGENTLRSELDIFYIFGLPCVHDDFLRRCLSLYSLDTVLHQLVKPRWVDMRNADLKEFFFFRLVKLIRYSDKFSNDSIIRTTMYSARALEGIKKKWSAGGGTIIGIKKKDLVFIGQDSDSKSSVSGAGL
jgi:hypothetical protein